MRGRVSVEGTEPVLNLILLPSFRPVLTSIFTPALIIAGYPIHIALASWMLIEQS